MSRSGLIALLLLPVVAGPATAARTTELAMPTQQPDGTPQRPVMRLRRWASTFSMRGSTRKAAAKRPGPGRSIPAITDDACQLARREARCGLRLRLATSAGI